VGGVDSEQETPPALYVFLAVYKIVLNLKVLIVTLNHAKVREMVR